MILYISYDVSAENISDEELEDPGSLKTQHPELQVPPEAPGSRNGDGSPDDSIRPQSCLPHSGVLIINSLIL